MLKEPLNGYEQTIKNYCKKYCKIFFDEKIIFQKFFCTEFWKNKEFLKKQGIFEKRSGVLKKIRSFEKGPEFSKRSGVFEKRSGVFKKVRSKDKSLGLNPYYVNGLRLNRT